MQVGEVAAAAAGDQDFFADTVGAFQDGNAATALPCLDGAHEAGRAAAENDDVKVVVHVYPASGAVELMSIFGSKRLASSKNA